MIFLNNILKQLWIIVTRTKANPDEFPISYLILFCLLLAALFVFELLRQFFPSVSEVRSLVEYIKLAYETLSQILTQMSDLNQRINELQNALDKVIKSQQSEVSPQNVWAAINSNIVHFSSFLSALLKIPVVFISNNVDFLLANITSLLNIITNSLENIYSEPINFKKSVVQFVLFSLLASIYYVAARSFAILSEIVHSLSWCIPSSPQLATNLKNLSDLMLAPFHALAPVARWLGLKKESVSKEKGTYLKGKGTGYCSRTH